MPQIQSNINITKYQQLLSKPSHNDQQIQQQTYKHQKCSYSDLKTSQNLVIANSLSKGLMNINLMKYAHKRKTLYQKNNMTNNNINNNLNNISKTSYKNKTMINQYHNPHSQLQYSNTQVQINAHNFYSQNLNHYTHNSSHINYNSNNNINYNNNNNNNNNNIHTSHTNYNSNSPTSNNKFANVVNLQFSQVKQNENMIKGISIKKPILIKPTVNNSNNNTSNNIGIINTNTQKQDKKFTTIQQVSKKIVNIYKQSNKTKYQQLIRQSVDEFFKSTLQIGPYAKSIIKENDMNDPSSRRKLIHIERVAFPLRQPKTNFIRNKTSNSRIYKTSREESSFSNVSKDQHANNNNNANNIDINNMNIPNPHKRMKSFLDNANLNNNNNPFTTQKQQQSIFSQRRPQTNHSSTHNTAKKTKPNLILQSLIPIRKPNNRKDYFVFGLADRTCTTENKIQMYRDLLWKINYSNCLYVYTPEAYVNNTSQSYKFYVGPGILKRRFWWTITNNKNQEGIHFLWTQLKINTYFKHQQSNSMPVFEKNNSNYQSQSENQSNNNIMSNSNTNIVINNITTNNQLCVSPSSNNIIQPQFLDISKIFSSQDLKIWKQHYKRNQKTQKTLQQNTYKKRLRLFQKKPINKIQDSNILRMHNHLQFNYYIGNKKALFYNIKRYYQLQQKNPFSIIPYTFHVKKGMQDIQWKKFMKYYQNLQENKKKNKNFKNMWIIKPGENTNRGNGISVAFGLDDIKIRINGRQRNRDGHLRTFILQKYIENPMLYQKRKFDIRHYALISCINGIFKFYWYQQGYIRTSSSQFNIKVNRDPLIHLTNDAIQKNTADYGKYQKGNKLSYQQFQKYLQSTYPQKKYNLFDQILPKMKLYALQAFKASYSILDQKRLGNNFELLGLDFMIDDNFQPWLIQINTNPCLQLSSPLLSRIIPHLIQNVCRICIDPLYPPPEYWPANKKTFFSQDPLSENKFQLIFDQTVHSHEVQMVFKDHKKIDQNMGKIQEEDQTYEDDGNQDWEDKKDKDV